MVADVVVVVVVVTPFGLLLVVVPRRRGREGGGETQRVQRFPHLRDGRKSLSRSAAADTNSNNSIRAIVVVVVVVALCHDMDDDHGAASAVSGTATWRDGNSDWVLQHVLCIVHGLGGLLIQRQ